MLSYLVVLVRRSWSTSALKIAACGFAHQYKPLDAEDLPLVLANYWHELGLAARSRRRQRRRDLQRHHPDHRRQLPTDRATHDQVARVMEIK